MALRIALDTNRYVDFCRGEQSVVDIVRSCREIKLPFVVLAELRAGFLLGEKQAHNSKILSRFLNSERVSIIFPDEQTTHHYAQIFYQLRRDGKPIPTNDLWIAALVIQHDLILCSNDKHFEALPQIATV